MNPFKKHDFYCGIELKEREFFYQKSKYFICLFFSCACSIPLQLLRIKNQELATCGSHVAAPVTEYACLIKMSEH